MTDTKHSSRPWRLGGSIVEEVARLQSINAELMKALSRIKVSWNAERDNPIGHFEHRSTFYDVFHKDGAYERAKAKGAS